MTVGEKEKCYLADLSIPDAAVKLVCPVTTILDSGSGISTMLEKLVAKLQAVGPAVQNVGPMTDDQYAKMTEGRLGLVKERLCPV